ncbi:hypothetical protein MPTA5024_05750 [Microbispora sp. ATCC PTA-5024]|nr:hypothetical protein MPTA5024_05750 [Microbispora sp. ATCC PTA-5024]
MRQVRGQRVLAPAHHHRRDLGPVEGVQQRAQELAQAGCAVPYGQCVRCPGGSPARVGGESVVRRPGFRMC